MLLPRGHESRTPLAFSRDLERGGEPTDLPRGPWHSWKALDVPPACGDDEDDGGKLQRGPRAASSSSPAVEHGHHHHHHLDHRHQQTHEQKDSDEPTAAAPRAVGSVRDEARHHADGEKTPAARVVETDRGSNAQQEQEPEPGCMAWMVRDFVWCFWFIVVVTSAVAGAGGYLVGHYWLRGVFDRIFY